MNDKTTFTAAGRRTSERGIAILFALGILSIVIVSVLIFSHRSSIDRKVASVYAHNTSAKYLAESALSRAILTLQHSSAEGNTFYSYDSSDTFDWLWKMDSDTVPLGTNCPVRWQYVTNGESGSDERIIGRFAYAILGQSLMNMNAVVDHKYCIAGSTCAGGSGCPRNDHYGIAATELDFDSSLFPFKKGSSSVTLSRETLNAQKDGSGIPLQYTSEQSFIADWGITGLGSSTSAGLVNQRLNTYFNISQNASLKEPDAWFAGDLNSNKVKDKTEYYQRFLLNKTATEWNAIANKTTGTQVDDILKAATAFYSGDTPVTTNTSGIPWLYHWSDTEGNWPDATTKSKQIAANLINYNAAETCPVVSDIAPSSWSVTNIPAYTGNKKTWYLNECKVFVTAFASPGDYQDHVYYDADVEKHWYSWGDTGNAVIDLRVTINPELIKIYKEVISGSYSVKLCGTLRVGYRVNDYSPSGTTFSNAAQASASRDILLSDSSYGCYETGLADNEGYKTFRFVSTSAAGDTSVQLLPLSIPVGKFAQDTNTPDCAARFQIESLEIQNLKMILTRDGSINEDYASVTDSIEASSSLKTDGVIQLTTDTKTLISSAYSVDDPRNNLHTADWVEKTATLGSVNTDVSCSGGSYSSSGWTKDPETKADPAYLAASGAISTAYIRHAPMKSPWELGAIHRAAPWQTINLKRPKSFSNDLTANWSTEGGGAYGDGDFRILDQVTMQGGTAYTPKEAFGKINLYAPGTTSRDFNFAALFNQMPYSDAGDYEVSSSSGGTVIDLTKAKTLAGYLGIAGDTLSLYRRTDIWGCTNDDFWKLFTTSPSGTTLEKDAQQEQLLGRVINLTKAETSSDSAIVIVMAQSIKDAEGTVYKDWSEDGTVTDGAVSTDQAKINAGYKRYDGETSPFPENSPTGKISATYGNYDNGADQITGEAKMLAYFLYDRDQQKWKLIQVKYEE